MAGKVLVPGGPPRRFPAPQVLVTKDQHDRLVREWNEIGGRLDKTLDLHAAAIAERSQEIAQWGIEHLVLLRVLVRSGLVTEAEIAAEREAMRAAFEDAKAQEAAVAAAPAKSDEPATEPTDEPTDQTTEVPDGTEGA